MAYNSPPSTSVDAKSVMDEILWGTYVKDNLDDLDARITALGGGGGGGSTEGDTTDDPRFAKDVNVETNLVKFWKRRFTPFENAGQLDFEGPVPGDLLDSDHNQRFMYPQSNDTTGDLLDTSDADAYYGYIYQLAKDNSLYFKKKKGENFIALGLKSGAAGFSDNFAVTVDGVAANTYGLIDEEGNARAASETTVTASTLRSNIFYFFGLDESKEELIKIENNDSGTDELHIEYIEVGFRPRETEYAIDYNLKVRNGTANVRGSFVDITETDLALTPSSGYGYTAAVVADTLGSVRKIEGPEPAMTYATPGTAIAFSSAVTSFSVKNNYFFPTSGFCLASMPYGNHHVFSYTSRTNDPTVAANINDHGFSGVKWQTQPVEDYTPRDGFDSTTAGDAFGDLTVNLVATGGLTIDSSNNKIDFQIALNGNSATTHAATIDSGLFSGSKEIMYLGDKIVEAMSAVKPLEGGRYFAEYNRGSKLWTIGVEGEEVDSFSLLFNSGANVANSIHGDLGFASTDQTGDLSYSGTTKAFHEAVRVFQRGEFDYPNGPRFKYNAADAATTDILRESIEYEYGLGYIRVQSGQLSEIHYYPDGKSCGAEFTFIGQDESGMLCVEIDGAEPIYICQTDRRMNQRSSVDMPYFMKFMISWPRGSKDITIRPLNFHKFVVDTEAGYNTMFCGARPLYTKPPFESIDTDEALIKAVDVAPLQLFETPYDHDFSALPNDNLQTITYNGSWSSAANNVFNNHERTNTTINDSVDVTFEIKGTVGGLWLPVIWYGSACQEVDIFLVQGTSASEVSSLIDIVSLAYPTGSATDNRYDKRIGVWGVPTGTYTLRLKNIDGGNINLSGFIVWDTKRIDDANTVSDSGVASQQGITYPVNVIKVPLIQETPHDVVPSFLERTRYRKGVASLYEASVNYTMNNISNATNWDDVNNVGLQDGYFRNYLYGSGASASDDYLTFIGVFKSMCTLDFSIQGIGSVTIQPVIDGTNSVNTYSQRVQTNTGNAPAATRGSQFPLFQKTYRQLASGDMSDSTTFLISDTRGIRVGQQVIVRRDGEDIVNTIASVTAGTSVTLDRAIANFADFTTANNAELIFYGFHSVILQNDATVQIASSGFGYEPMDLTESGFEKRRLKLQSNKGERAYIRYKSVANGDDLGPPIFKSDGRPATLTEMIIIPIAKTTASYVAFPEGLKNIAASGTNDVEIHAIRRF